MTRMFSDDGRVIPVTLIQSGPVVITQLKTSETDGYTAAQVSFGSKKHINKAQVGHFANLGSFAVSREIRLNSEELPEKGASFDTSIFSIGDIVKVTGLSKSKGFQGGVKRHGFAGMPATHGHHHVLRHVGSGGQRFPQHTLKGSRGPGRMGGERVAVRGVKVAFLDIEKGLIGVKGSIPGRKGTLVEIIKIK